MNRTIILGCIMIIILIACSPSSNTNQNVTDKPVEVINFGQLASKIVELSDLQPSETVLLVMAPGDFDPIIEEIKNQVISSGAEYLGALSISGQQPEAWSTTFTDRCIGQDAGGLEKVFDEVDLGIMLPGATPEHLPYKVLQDMLQSGRRTIHFHWSGAYDLNGNLLPTSDEIGEFYQNVVLHTDYPELAASQVKFEEAMRDAEVHVSTPEGTDIRFMIGDRPVTKQDGNASAKRALTGKNLIDREVEIPSGAIRVAPIESSVQGTIAFPDALWDEEEVVGLKVKIENGKITSVDATSGKEAVLREMSEAGESGSAFREFALGFNPMMPVQKTDNPWIPYYGYGAGVVRLSLGDNTELGGNVTGGYVRWNFFPNATVKIGDDTWVEEGRLVK